MNKLIVLTGPTAVGKTKLSIELAKRVGGEIISADSMQVYKKMDIGSAKITKDEMDGIPHYLIDILEPWEDFNVVIFQEMAKKAMEDIYSRGNIPIIVGGTGFYIQALLYDIDFKEEDEEKEYRSELEEISKEENGSERLYELLKKVDFKAAEDIHPNNVKKVIRALEFFKHTGERISEHNAKEREKKSPYDFKYFVLNDKREKLYARIDSRVDKMIEAGLVDEVKELLSTGVTKSNISMEGLGYKEIIQYLDGGISLEDAVYKIKRDTRHFAKRQLTWFRREKDVIWVNKDEFEYDDNKILDFMVKNEN
ncbi:MAG: tRNA (adenosine(37)-N6)-dimethylallyltransferase MiaA [Lachnospiraceae bacterium]|nr:tRNA (adenosine(37)-N6)-dimethylallyltransferase MiaA [Lachnospiraceae bacterium]